MAQPTNTFDSYHSIGNKDDLSEVIYNLSPTQTTVPVDGPATQGQEHLPRMADRFARGRRAECGDRGRRRHARRELADAARRQLHADLGQDRGRQRHPGGRRQGRPQVGAELPDRQALEGAEAGHGVHPDRQPGLGRRQLDASPAPRARSRRGSPATSTAAPAAFPAASPAASSARRPMAPSGPTRRRC